MDQVGFVLADVQDVGMRAGQAFVKDQRTLDI